MSDILDRSEVRNLQAEAVSDALDTVLWSLTAAMKPKAKAKVRANLEHYAARLETFEGCRLSPNVVPLDHVRRALRSGIPMARATEAQRVERAMRAEAIRTLLGKVF